MKRPVGVTVISVLLMIGAVISILAGLAALGVFGASTAAGIAIVTLVLGVLQFVVALGLWSLQKWAWTFTIVVVLLRIASDIWGLFANVGLAAVIGSLVVNVIVFLYLWSRGVRAAFA